jgi:hypothetical protein
VDRQALQELLKAVLERGMPFRFEARGHSMHPFIRDRDVVTVAPLPARPLLQGEIVAFRHPMSGALVLHRVREVRAEGLLVQGDNAQRSDGVIGEGDLLGLVTRAEREGVLVYTGEEAPGIGDRLAWSSCLWLGQLARHLAALLGERR